MIFGAYFPNLSFFTGESRKTRLLDVDYSTVCCSERDDHRPDGRRCVQLASLFGESAPEHSDGSRDARVGLAEE